MAAIVPSSVTFVDIYRTLFRHKWKTLFFFFGVFTAVTLVTLQSPKTYRSESELFVRLGRENVTLDPVATLGQETAVAVPMSRENEINSLVEVLQNRTLRERVVDAVGAAVILGRETRPGPAAAPNPLQAMKSRLSAIVAPRIDDRERAVLALAAGLSRSRRPGARTFCECPTTPPARKSRRKSFPASSASSWNSTSSSAGPRGARVPGPADRGVPQAVHGRRAAAL